MSRMRGAAAGFLLMLAIPLAACTRTAEAPDASNPTPLTAVLPERSLVAVNHGFTPVLGLSEQLARVFA